MCLGAIYWARPRRVIYANTREEAAAIDFDDNFIYAEIAAPIGDRKIPFIHSSPQGGYGRCSPVGRAGPVNKNIEQAASCRLIGSWIYVSRYKK